jgi:hypothetical protein
MKFISVFLLGIVFSYSALAADPSMATEQATAPGEIQAPIALSGVVTPLQGVSFCMDGATHLIQSPIGVFRLKGRNAEAAKALTSVADGKKKITLMGYPVPGPECTFISVYNVAAMNDVVKVLAGPIGPWPFITNH